MTVPKATAATASKILGEQVSARSGNAVRKVVKFSNEDVPNYLENLRRFRDESRKVTIVVK